MLRNRKEAKERRKMFKHQSPPAHLKDISSPLLSGSEIELNLDTFEPSNNISLKRKISDQKDADVNERARVGAGGDSEYNDDEGGTARKRVKSEHPSFVECYSSSPGDIRDNVLEIIIGEIVSSSCSLSETSMDQSSFVVSSAADSTEDHDTVGDEEECFENYPHLNNFPDPDMLEVNPEDDDDDDEGVLDTTVVEESEDLVITSDTFKCPDSDKYSTRTSEMDTIIYSDRTSSEFIPDYRNCGHHDPVSYWDAET